MSILESVNRQEFIGSTSDLTNEQYHASSGWSSTVFKQYLKAPALALAMKQRPFAQTESLYFGQKFHEYLLEQKEVVAVPKFDKRTKEGKEGDASFRAENAGKLIFDWFDKTESNLNAVESIKGMADSVRRHPIASQILSDGVAEQSHYARCPDTGLYLKARTDWLTRDLIIADVKTTSKSAAPEEFERDIFNYGYYLSAAWYTYVLSLLTGKSTDNFLFITVEKTYPYLCSVSVIKEPVLMLGWQKILQGLPRLRESIERNEWPGYPDYVHEVGIPEWAMRKEEMKLFSEEVA